MNIDLRKVRGTPYKLVLSDWCVIGIIERIDNKDTYIERSRFSKSHKKIADLVHARTLIERVKSA